jgi:hypothetical protein
MLIHLRPWLFLRRSLFSFVLFATSYSLPQKAGEGKKRSVEKFPRPFLWERARVRAISSSAGGRRIMNHFAVVIEKGPAGIPPGLFVPVCLTEIYFIRSALILSSASRGGCRSS